MMKLTVNRLQELASSLPQSGRLSTEQQLTIKGGGDEDTRNPPGVNGKSSSSSSGGGNTGSATSNGSV